MLGRRAALLLEAFSGTRFGWRHGRAASATASLSSATCVSAPSPTSSVRGRASAPPGALKTVLVAREPQPRGERWGPFSLSTGLGAVRLPPTHALSVPWVSLAQRRDALLLAQRRLSGNAAGATRPEGETSGEDSVHLSDGCVRRLQELGDEDASASLLRVAVDGGGCSGFQYSFSLISRDELTADDREFSRGGVIVVVDSLSLGFLKGATIDYSEELIKSSFCIIDNPNTEASCGCGASFAPK